MNINGLSVSELKQLLSQVEAELSIIDNEHHICNSIAKTFSGKQYTVEYHKKIKADIQIQLDILEFMNNGGSIQFADHSGKLNSKAFRGARAGKRLHKRFGVV